MDELRSASHDIAAYKGLAHLLTVLIAKRILTVEEAVSICVDAANPCKTRGEIYNDATQLAAAKLLTDFATVLKADAVSSPH
jgi:hypothetical protein